MVGYDRPWTILGRCVEFPCFQGRDDGQGIGGVNSRMAGKVPKWENTIDPDYLSGLRSIGCPIQPEKEILPGAGTESFPPDPEAPLDNRSKVTEIRRIAKSLGAGDLDKLLKIARILTE